jgi:hypothetical protein
VYLPVAVGTDKHAFIEFDLELVERQASVFGYGEVLLALVQVMEF